MQILAKSTKKGIGELKNTDTKYSRSEKLTQKSSTSSQHIPPPKYLFNSLVQEIVLWFSYEQKFWILHKLASAMS